MPYAGGTANCFNRKVIDFWMSMIINHRQDAA
jgi:hypothetical protein